MSSTNLGMKQIKTEGLKFVSYAENRLLEKSNTTSISRMCTKHQRFIVVAFVYDSLIIAGAKINM